MKNFKKMVLVPYKESQVYENALNVTESFPEVSEDITDILRNKDLGDDEKIKLYLSAYAKHRDKYNPAKTVRPEILALDKISSELKQVKENNNNATEELKTHYSNFKKELQESILANVKEEIDNKLNGSTYNQFYEDTNNIYNKSINQEQTAMLKDYLHKNLGYNLNPEYSAYDNTLIVNKKKQKTVDKLENSFDKNATVQYTSSPLDKASSHLNQTPKIEDYLYKHLDVPSITTDRNGISIPVKNQVKNFLGRDTKARRSLQNNQVKTGYKSRSAKDKNINYKDLSTSFDSDDLNSSRIANKNSLINTNFFAPLK